MAKPATTESSLMPPPPGVSDIAGCAAVVEVLLIYLDIAPAAVVGAAALLSDEERKRGARFAYARDRSRYTVAHAWLRRLLGVRLGVPPEAVELVYGEHGKPALGRRQAASGLHFNLSSSRGLAACAITGGRDIGVDIECLLPLAAVTEIGDRFFSQSEQASYRALPDHDKAQGFFNCWTRKEAFVKALGVGLSLSLDSFDVSLAPDEPARILRVGTASGEDCGWKLRSFQPSPGFVGAIVVREPAGAAAPLPLQVH